MALTVQLVCLYLLWTWPLSWRACFVVLAVMLVTAQLDRWGERKDR